MVSLVVLIHYFFLRHTTKYLPLLPIPHHFRIIFVVLSCVLAHVLEIWLFAFAYYFIQASDSWGGFAGSFNGTLVDCVYYSAITYTTLGFGDITPVGNIRLLTAMEALLGLILIAWTATFIYNQLDESDNLK